MTSQLLRSMGKSRVARRALWTLGLGVALVAALPGCVAHAQAEFVPDYPAVYVETVPPRIEYYPQTYYRGSPAYLVDGRWYSRAHDRWVVFREEPVELRDYRVQHGGDYRQPSARYEGRGQERWIEQRRAEQRQIDERRAEQRRIEERRIEQRQVEQRQMEQRRAEQQREAQRRAQQQQQQQRYEQQRYEQQREAEHRAEQDRRLAERRGSATRQQNRAQGGKKNEKDEHDRRARPD